ncbi:unnamed protein product [Nippostrongylus brasiliensis]|uniref:Uncharacterized protein n=1 Tax=Nippostrongylus brasiliensis TaxID=27835 RepID=A0A0N4XL47_NIPBR|nr:unnamed protein product [Nippostrongylus brasiliensis]
MSIYQVSHRSPSSVCGQCDFRLHLGRQRSPVFIVPVSRRLTGVPAKVGIGQLVVASVRSAISIENRRLQAEDGYLSYWFRPPNTATESVEQYLLCERFLATSQLF